MTALNYYIGRGEPRDCEGGIEDGPFLSLDEAKAALVKLIDEDDGLGFILQARAGPWDRYITPDAVSRWLDELTENERGEYGDAHTSIDFAGLAKAISVFLATQPAPDWLIDSTEPTPYRLAGETLAEVAS